MLPMTPASTGTTLFIAAIGASAGGLEALTEFFSHLPPQIENLAIVIAQHFSPEHRSQLAEFLGQVTAWPVLEIQNKMPIEAGKVYVLPPDREISFNKLTFQLTPAPAGKGPKPSVDRLLRLLALQPDVQPIAVILSGTGQDGTLGLAPIKLAGGWIFAQTPEQAKFNGMPLAAIQTGSVDYVLEPAQMGSKIQQLILEAAQARVAEPAESCEPLPELLKLLAQRSGTDFSGYKPSTLMRRIEHRQMLLKLPDLPAYLSWVRQHPQELDVLFQTLLIRVTGFFRDPEVFACLEPYLEQMLLNKAPGDALRIWVPGCSTGEEAYTLAMIVQRLLEAHNLTTPVQIFATDLDQQALAFARAGVYDHKALQHLSSALRNSCFQESEGQYLLLKTLRNRVLFSQHDLTFHPPFLKLDLISCRNLLIYFGPGIQKSILPAFHTALNPAGLLLLGKSENVGATHGLFETVNSPCKLYRASRAPQQPLGKSQPLPPSLKPIVPHQPDPEPLLRKALNKLLVEVFPHPCVLINEAFEVLKISGDLSPFLSLKEDLKRHHLLDICRPELKLEIRSLMVQAQHEGRAVAGAFRRVSAAAELLRIHINPGAQVMSAQILVVFECVLIPLAESASPKTLASQRLAELEMEMAVREARMEALLEQLDFAHQHQQVLNEELQSANEELQVSNEELTTSNQELQTSSEEVQRAYSELLATYALLEDKDQLLLNSKALLLDTQKLTGIGGWEINMLTGEVNWTPEIYMIYGLSQAEPIDLEKVLQAYLPASRARLESAIQRATEQGEAYDLELELLRQNGEQVWVRATSRVTRQNGKTIRLNGTLKDISQTKRAVTEKNALIQELTAKNEDLNQFTYIISHNLRTPVANLLGLINVIEMENHIQAEGLELFQHCHQMVTKLDDTIIDLNRILSIRRHRDELSKVVDLEFELDWAIDDLSSHFPELESWVQSDFAVTQFFSVGTYIQSMIFNLLSNALKYRDPHRVPEIHFSSGRKGEYLWIAVQDNGLGLDLARIQDRLFRLYMRFHPHIEGKGMGLYLLKTQAEALGGGVEVSSELGQGSRFYVYFKESVPEQKTPE